MADVTINEIFFQLIFGHNIEGVKMLLSNYNVDPNINFMGLNMLSHAILYNDIEIVKMLLQYGAKHEQPSLDGSYPIEIAKQHNHKEILEIFDNLLIDIKEPEPEP